MWGWWLVYVVFVQTRRRHFVVPMSAKKRDARELPQIRTNSCFDTQELDSRSESRGAAPLSPLPQVQSEGQTNVLPCQIMLHTAADLLIMATSSEDMFKVSTVPSTRAVANMTRLKTSDIKALEPGLHSCLLPFTSILKIAPDNSALPGEENWCATGAIHI